MSDITLDSVVYADLGTSNGIHLWSDHSAGVPAGFSNLTQRINYTKERVNFLGKLYLPILNTTASACACPGDLLDDVYLDVVVRSSKKTDSDTRAFILQAAKDYVNSPQFAGMLTNFVP